MDQAIDFGNSLDWLGKGSEPAAETPAQADDKAPLATEAGEGEKPAETPADIKVEDATETTLPVSTVVDELGGEDAARQFIPLIRAIESVDVEPEKLGENLQSAILKILTPDQFGALTWAQYDKYGEIMASQYIEEHPEFAQKLGLVKADAVPAKTAVSDYDDDLIEPETEELSPREAAMKAELDAIKQQLGQIQQKDARTEQEKKQQTEQEQYQTVKATAEKAMFGTVIDENFGKLEGWTDDELQRTMKIAFAAFNADQTAVDQYKKGLEYQKTQQALLAGWQVKAKNTFANHLKDAIELVDSKRTKTATATAPVPPKRQEISSTTPTKEATQPQGDGTTKFFDARDLMTRVQERLRSQGATR